MVDLPADGHIQSLNAGSTGDDGNLVGFIHHIIDLEEADRETMHLLVFLLMQFLSRSDQVTVDTYIHVMFAWLLGQEVILSPLVREIFYSAEAIKYFVDLYFVIVYVEFHVGLIYENFKTGQK